MIAILGAMDAEIQELTAELQQPEALNHQGIVGIKGVLNNKNVVITKCGIGKVNAAMTTQALLSLGIESLIFTGVAGGVQAGLKVGDIVISTDLVQHDVDVTPLGYARGLIPDESISWEADPQLRAIALEAAQAIPEINVVEGRIVSGDQFIADPAKVAWLQSSFNACAAEMEGAAVAQVCSKWGVPFVVIRSLSDTSDGGADVDYPTFMPVVAKRAKAVVRGMLDRL